MLRVKPNIDSLCGLMLAGDEKTKLMKKNAILLVGSTRVGKSTLFNYLNGKALRAVFN